MAINKSNLSLAGEFRVASELLKLNLMASITYGNMKSTDIVAVGKNRKAAVVEVKASQRKKFVTGIYQRYKDETQPTPDFWVLFLVGSEGDRFFVMSHNEMLDAQGLRNSPKKKLTHAEHVAKAAKGVDNVRIADVEQHENTWQKIVDFCGGAL